MDLKIWENNAKIISCKQLTSWLKDTGLSVNESKTEICVFYHKPTPLLELVLNNGTIKSQNIMNALGVLFDSTLSLINQISQTITKSKKALHALQSVLKKNISTRMSC